MHSMAVKLIALLAFTPLFVAKACIDMISTLNQNLLDYLPGGFVCGDCVGFGRLGFGIVWGFEVGFWIGVVGLGFGCGFGIWGLYWIGLCVLG